MAGGASSPSTTSPSSFSTWVFTHDAFLSFRGEDTRYGFAGNLYSALDHRGINTFFDDKELRIGNEIRPSLLGAIERSRTAIVVLSKDYASSSFCLDELAKIMECVHGQGRLVIPIFYEVAPTHVRHLTGTYGDALSAHENKFRAKRDKQDENMERLGRWKMALKQVADLSGYHFNHGDYYEYQFIASIVEQVSRQIRRRLLPTVDHPVGLAAHVQEVTKLLDLGSDDIRIVGIHGIGGVGKTTLAVAVYNAIADSFEHLSFRLCFMGDIRENSERHGLPHLQKIVLSELFEEKGEVTCVKHGISILKPKFEGKKILLVLDDVDKEKQLKALAGESNWFGRGSRVIITTRDKNLLSRYKDKITYELETLNEKDSIELLSSKALKTNQVDSSFMDVLKEVVTFASGLPLALEVIGSNLVGKSIEQWKSILYQYKRFPNEEIQTILKVSFDALEKFEKEIFLDVACCLKGYGLKDVMEILCAHHRFPVSLENVFDVLVEKSLIKIDGLSRVTLHDLIQDMGREIVCEKSRNNPGERNRLWLLEDIVQVFEKNMGTDKIEMIHMDSPIYEKVINWDGEAFKKMTNIRTLIIKQACFSQVPKLLPNSLRVLKWQQYPSHSLSVGFHPEELVIFQLSDSSLTSVEFLHKQKFKSLTVINLDLSDIEEIPDVSGVPNLKELSFGFCQNLIKVHESVGFLDALKLLNAEGCGSLRSFPPIKLTNLEDLRLEDCFSLENFPEILGKMENILETSVFGTAIKELPSSIANLSKLRRLTLENNATSHLSISSIAMLPCLEELVFGPSHRGLQFPKFDKGEEQRSSMLSSNPQKVTLWRCHMSDECWPLIVAWFRNVVELDLRGNNFTVLPESIQELCSLRRLDLTDCKKLQEIRGIPPNMNECFAAECISLTCSSKTMLLNEEFHKDGNKLVHLPGSTIPEWFEHNNTESSIHFWFRNKVPEICLCVINDNYMGGTISWVLTINGNEFSSGSFHSKYYYIWFTGGAHIAIVGLKRMAFDHDNIDKVLSENEWNHAECHFSSDDWRMRWKIGVHVINHKSSMDDDIQFPNPGHDSQHFMRSLCHSLPMNSWDHPPAENSLKDYVSNAVAQIGISSTTSNVQENTAAESSEAPSSDITGGEEHLTTCCTELPTSDDSFRIQNDSSQDDDLEMEKFYASLDSRSHILSCSHDHSATTAPNKEAREALKIVQGFITNTDASVFLDLEQCSIMKTSLDCLSNLSENGGLSEKTSALVSEASRVFNHCKSNYIEANMKIESSASELLRAGELEADLEDNKNQFKEVVALEKEQHQNLACLEESKKELEKQINAINANILASQSEHNITRKRKRDIFEEGKTLKTQVDKLKEKVPHLQHKQDLAKETQEKIKAEWSGLGEKFRKIVVE